MCTFNLKIQEDHDHPWRMLIHERCEAAEPNFEYANLVDTEMYRACTKLVALRSPAMKWIACLTILGLLVCTLWYRIEGSSDTTIQTTLAVSGFSGLLSMNTDMLAEPLHHKHQGKSAQKYIHPILWKNTNLSSSHKSHIYHRTHSLISAMTSLIICST